MPLQFLEFEVVSQSVEWLGIVYVFLIVPVASFLSLAVLLEVILDSLVRLKESRS